MTMDIDSQSNPAGGKDTAMVTHDAPASPVSTAVSSDGWSGRVSNAARETLLIDSGDSVMGDVDLESSTTSVHSSIYKYVEENGHTYHRYKEGSVPREIEQERLDLQHQLFLLTFDNKLHLAPIKEDVCNVLDIGTGTGIWAIEFANSHPSAYVIGTDLSPIQPDYLPPNCHFEVDDAEDDWNYPQPFDFIHGRALVTCFQDPAVVIAKAYAALAPGGHLELQDLVFPTRGIDDTYRGCASERLTMAVMEAARRLGKDFTHSRRYKQYLEAAGFVDIREHHFQWPIGFWPKGEKLKLMGLYFRQDLVQGLEGIAMALLTRGLGLTPEAVKEWVEEAKGNLLDPKIHAYMPGIVVYGRKASVS